MSFELKRGEAVPKGIRRIVCERAEKALAVLDRNGTKTVGDKRVHDARKRFKEVRGALRMVRGDLGDKQFRRENRVFRDAGRPLSEVRDAKVLVDTLGELVEHYKAQLAAEPFKHLRGALNARRRDVRKQVLDKKGTTRSIVSKVRKSLRRVGDWPLTHNGWKAIAAGLRQTYDQGRKSMQAAINDGSDEAFHEWRKRTKDLRYGIELLARAWPETMQSMAQAAHDLTDLLGQDHDLAVLLTVVDSEPKNVCPDDERELLTPLVAQRRTELWAEARELGRKLFAETDDQFVDRIHGYWKAWR